MFFWRLAIKKPLTVAAIRGGANAKRSQYLRRYGHKYSDLIRVVQRKSGLNAISKEKKTKPKRGRKAGSNKNDVQA